MEKTKRRSSMFARTLKRAFFGSRAGDVHEEELVQSPAITAFSNFLDNKFAVVGAVVFALIVISCVALSFVFPLDLNYVDTTQQNAAPGFYMLDVPSALKNNALKVDTGSTFGAGIDKNGKMYVWGRFAGATANNKLYNIPEGVKFKDVACGLDHIVALGEDGKLYTWGNDRLGLKSIPAASNKKNIVQIDAGENISLALDDKGTLHVWGAQNVIKIRPKNAKGKIVRFALTPLTAFALNDKGEVFVLSNDELIYSDIPEEVQGHAVDISATKDTAAAILDDGRAVVWGNSRSVTYEVPENVSNAVKIVSGRYHYTVLKADGTVVSWGMENFGQEKSPSNSNVTDVSSGFFNNTAITAEGKVLTWGLSGYLMGTDHFGRDVFRRLLSGGQTTLTVGAVSVIIAGIIGILIGGLSGYYGGKVDMLLMRATEVFSAIPFLPLAIILSAVIGNRLSQNARIVMIMAILGLLSWTGLARLTRAQVLAERESEFITAANAMGVKRGAIIFRHILPNVIAVILVSLTLDLATCMLTESTLSFLGFGVQEPMSTWGNMLYSCVDSIVIRNYWWRWVFPALSLALATISVNLVGDGLSDAIDPKSNDR